jgi:hypothetical protein
MPELIIWIEYHRPNNLDSSRERQAFFSCEKGEIGRIPDWVGDVATETLRGCPDFLPLFSF